MLPVVIQKRLNATLGPGTRSSGTFQLRRTERGLKTAHDLGHGPRASRENGDNALTTILSGTVSAQ